eukprot:TRINITY_DN66770_c0_g1_i1.p1 TRINITY_DN66770_c0_g1~~TRINITY_DN66770_c0_g1_i1.p1  ORF type:complete len:169 (-),score=18.01 TRINITY_DN66770_c0_g1_i1:157-663(-)
MDRVAESNSQRALAVDKACMPRLETQEFSSSPSIALTQSEVKGKKDTSVTPRLSPDLLCMHTQRQAGTRSLSACNFKSVPAMMEKQKKSKCSLSSAVSPCSTSAISELTLSSSMNSQNAVVNMPVPLECVDAEAIVSYVRSVELGKLKGHVQGSRSRLSFLRCGRRRV